MNNAKGHILAVITVVIWATTFVSTKVLLTDFTPIEILLFRFLIGLIVLIIIYPKMLKVECKKQEFVFAAAGLCGVCLYYLIEIIALTYTMASNVGVIISVSPFFTAVLSVIFIKKHEKLKINFFVGFLLALIGICLISFNGSKIQFNPLGDILAVLAALVWAVYSLIMAKISGYGYNVIQTTRRVFIYGIIFMFLAVFIFGFEFNIYNFTKPIYILNIVYLGVGASAICFLTWNFSVKTIGALKTSIYIYIVPVITVIASAIVLKEKLTLISILGTVLTIAGLIVSQIKK